MDNELILWLEYKDIKRGKDSIIKLLKRNFTDIEEYKVLNNSEFDINNFHDATMASKNNNF